MKTLERHIKYLRRVFGDTGASHILISEGFLLLGLALVLGKALKL